MLNGASVQKEDITDVCSLSWPSFPSFTNAWIRVRRRSSSPIARRVFPGCRNSLRKRDLGGKFNPEEAVAYDAAVQGHILPGDSRLSDGAIPTTIYPLTVDTETTKGVVAKLVPPNSVCPLTSRRRAPPARITSPLVLTQVFAGGHSLTNDDELLAEAEVIGIPPSAVSRRSK